MLCWCVQQAATLSLASRHCFLSCCPSEAVLSTSCHIARLFESLSPSPTAFCFFFLFPFSSSHTLANQMDFLAGTRVAALSSSGHFSSAWLSSRFPSWNKCWGSGSRQREAAPTPLSPPVPPASGQGREEAEGMEPALCCLRRPVWYCAQQEKGCPHPKEGFSLHLHTAAPAIPICLSRWAGADNRAGFTAPQSRCLQHDVQTAVFMQTGQKSRCKGYQL